MKTHNLSPWIDKLQRNYTSYQLKKDQITDIAIIGGGIAGISTAYFVLKNTAFNVTLFERDIVASGATGHNAGQVVSYFERHLSSIAREFGCSRAISGQKAIDGSWSLMKEICKNAQISVKLNEFIGYSGCQSKEEILSYLQDLYIYKKSHKKTKPIFIAENKKTILKIDKKYEGLYEFIPQKKILSLLETNDPHYLAVVVQKKGSINSALFCSELCSYLVNLYPKRFTIFEKSKVEKIYLDKNSASFSVGNYKIACKRIVLCTNGYTDFSIVNLLGKDVNKKFHKSISGLIGYMAAYQEMDKRKPTAISYLPNTDLLIQGRDALDFPPYFYVTRRPYKDSLRQQNLLCIGGPEHKISPQMTYSQDDPYPENIREDIDEFIHKTYPFLKTTPVKLCYCWHGLMGYTPNSIRRIGPEPLNPVLMYNIGCNGVGILPSIYGGKRISEIIAGKRLRKSIFDIKSSHFQHNQSRVKTNITA